MRPRRQRGHILHVLYVCVVLGGVVAAWVYWSAREPPRASPAEMAAQEKLEQQRLLQLSENQLPEVHEGPCLPLAWRYGEPAPDPSPGEPWTAVDATGARFAEDGCGAVWALWYNTWTVLLEDDPAVTARFGLKSLPGLPRDLPINGPVYDFLFTPDHALWILHSVGTVLRATAQGWTTPGNRMHGNGRGRIAWHEGTVWLTSPPIQGPQGLQRWDEASGAWQPVPLPDRASLELIESTDAGTLLGAGEQGLFERAADGSWKRIADTGGKPLALAASNGYAWLGTETGLSRVGPDGTTERLFEGERVEGVVARPGGRAWVALRDKGLRWYDGERWHGWRYAEGLPSDDAMGLWLSDAGRLWAGGTPMAVIDVDAAERAVADLRSPDPLPAQRFAGACEATRAWLGPRRASGAVAHEEVEGQTTAFFDGRQVCPNPRAGAHRQSLSARRERDGAVLRAPVNGVRGHNRCGTPCQPAALEGLRADSTLSVFTPRGEAAALRFDRHTLPAPEPIPHASPTPVLLLDDDGSVWVGDQSEGLWQHDGERWRLHGEKAGLAPANRGTDIRADGEGGIWYATHPRYLREDKAYAGANLHHYDGSRWRHWSPDDGLGYWSASALAVLPGATAVATNGGLSLLGPEGVQNFGAEAMAGRTTVQAMTSDADGALWLVHGVFHPGVTLFDGQRFSGLTSREGLFADNLQFVAVDGEGRVWLQAESGEVAVYEREVLVETAER